MYHRLCLGDGNVAFCVAEGNRCYSNPPSPFPDPDGIITVALYSCGKKSPDPLIMMALKGNGRTRFLLVAETNVHGSAEVSQRR